MLKNFIFPVLFILMGVATFAQDLAYILPQTQPTPQNIQTLIQEENYSAAKNLLEQAYENSQTKQEKEEITLTLAYIATQEQDYNKAIRLYRQLLNSNPSLTIARFNLAWIYFLKKEYSAARFNMQLALAQKNLPADMRMQGSYLLYQIRQEKVWNAEISVGIAPDTNVNGVSGKQIECFYWYGLPFCRELESIQSDVGFQGSGIFDYTYKFNNKWSIKNRLSIDAIHYDDERFSFWSMGLASGPRYTARRGEYWLAGSYKKQFNEEHRYANTWSVFADISRDLGRKFSLYSKIEFSDISYEKDLYQVFDSKEYSFNSRLFFFLNSWSYLALGLSYSLDDARADYNSFFRHNYSLGLGMQLPYGFNIYVEPNFANSQYLHKGTYITKGTLVEQKRKENTQGVFVSLSSNLLSVYDFTPRINFLYNKRTSNIESYGFERTRWEFGISKAF
jgi:Predicted N-acetylglucosaminyl transferase